MAVWISGSPLDAIIFPICWCEQDYEEFIHRRFVEGHVQELMSNIPRVSVHWNLPTHFGEMCYKHAYCSYRLCECFEFFFLFLKIPNIFTIF